VSNLAFSLVERLVKRIDSRIISVPFCNLAEHGNPRLKVSMLHLLVKTQLLEDLYIQKPAAVLR
jgi:hypothetical protein